MKALIITAPETSEFIEIEKPTPKPDEVLLRIHNVGYCGGDLNVFRGRSALTALPRIPCHELGCTIVEKGADVPDTFSIGQEVTLSPYTACGVCSSCLAGRENCCKNNQTFGAQRDGGLTEYLAVPWKKLFWSEKLSLRELTLVEPLSVGFHAAARGRVTAQDTVAVFGCGAIGLGVIAGAAHRGARVIAIDIDDKKLALARKIGAAETINNKTQDLHETLQALTNNHGPNVVIEAIGLTQTFQAAITEVAFAGRVVYVGYAKDAIEYDTRFFLLKELDILGSRNATNEDFQAVIDYLESGKFPVDDVITQTFPFSEAGAAFTAWSNHPEQFTKIQIDITA